LSLAAFFFISGLQTIPVAFLTDIQAANTNGKLVLKFPDQNTSHVPDPFDHNYLA